MKRLTAASMFAGIGGICLGFRQAGFDIVWANEKDNAACHTYRYNFGSILLRECDIKTVNAIDIPDMDVLTAGFPCQPFSVAGKQKGFCDPRGSLFFEIARIAEVKRPKVIFLENVSNLTSTLDSIINRHEKKHDIYYYPKGSKVIEKYGNQIKDVHYIYRISDKGLIRVRDHFCPTLTANMGTYPDRVPIVCDDYGIRRLTLRECLNFQGFPQDFRFPNTITIHDAYKQIGNSVCVPVIRRIAKEIFQTLSQAGGV